MVKTKVRLYDGAVVRIQQINADSGDLTVYDGVNVLQIKYTDIAGMNVSDPIHPAPNPGIISYDLDKLREEDHKAMDESLSKKSPGVANSSATGSLRFNTGKPQTSELDPEFLLGMGRVLEKARQKYPRGNWALGNQWSVPWDSMMRHLLAWQSGESLDAESGQNHLYHAALNLMMLAHYEENFPEMDDRIFKKAKK